MRAVIQRVSSCKVDVDGIEISKIQQGLLVLWAIESEDTDEDINWLVAKITQMRIFPDSEGKMNESILDKEGELMLVSQFTLYANTKKGNRPSFIQSAKQEFAIPMYEKSIVAFKKIIDDQKVKTGVFGANMQVSLCNDGPVTIIIDSKNKEL